MYNVYDLNMKPLLKNVDDNTLAKNLGYYNWNDLTDAFIILKDVINFDVYKLAIDFS